MVCGAALNYKWKQKGLSSAFSPECDSDSLAQAGRGHKTGGDTHTHDPVHANLSAPLDPAFPKLFFTLIYVNWLVFSFF